MTAEDTTTDDDPFYQSHSLIPYHIHTSDGHDVTVHCIVDYTHIAIDYRRIQWLAYRLRFIPHLLHWRDDDYYIIRPCSILFICSGVVLMTDDTVD